jgi:starch synthase
MTRLRVLSVTSEIYPLIKTGGLADVAGALPIALRAEGCETITLIPGYPAVMSLIGQTQVVLEGQIFGVNVRVLRASYALLDLFVLDAPDFFARPGNPYLTPEGVDWPDNGRRFAALSRTAAMIGSGAISSFSPDIVQLHDWQSALTAAYLHYGGQQRSKTVLTIHNLAYQGRFLRHILDDIGLPQESFNIHGLEYYGDVSFLKGGLQFADRLTTVSPTYAREIQGDEQGMGLGGVLRERSRDLSGILNGIDIDVWNPATDRATARCFTSSDLHERQANKTALQTRFGIEHKSDAFLLGVISRLSWQKGLDLLIECIPAIVDLGAQLVVLGTGEADLENRFREVAKQQPKQIGVLIGYDENLAHLVQAGSDALVVPSRFEPCGLTQLCALRYGAVPIVSRVGGLEDTIVDGGEQPNAATGFKFEPVDIEQLINALVRARDRFANKPAWRQMQLQGMATDVSWTSRASQYARLYRELRAEVR